jgi:predicted PurR-regulated permease PerM
LAESYPSPTDRSSPAPPEFPSLPPDQRKSQFSLQQLLAFMLAACGLAMAARPVVQILTRMPAGELGQLATWILLSLLCGAALYVLVRGPFLVWHGVRIARRWRNVSRHRQQLTAWAKSQSEAAREPPDKQR